MPPAAFALLRVLNAGGFHTREALSRALGLNDDELELSVRALAEAGVAVSRTEAGCRLEERVDLIDADALAAHLRMRVSDIEVEVMDECGSTNSVLRAAPDRHAKALVCELQTAGRGRRGNVWQSQLARALTFSLGWRIALPQRELGGLTLAAAVACAQALEALGYDDVRLKWPNDLMRAGAKLGGILVEVAGGAEAYTDVVIGVGLNVRADEGLRARVDRPVADLGADGRSSPGRTLLLASLLHELEHALRRYERCGFSAFRDEWLRRHAYQDRRVSMMMNDQDRVEGLAHDVADDGALVLRTEAGLRRFHAGEVSLREAA